MEKFPNSLICPNCGDNAFNMGRHFKAPKSKDKKQWKKIKFLYDHGFKFQKIRIPKVVNGLRVTTHHDVVPYPKTLEEAKEFVVMYREYAIKS